MSDTTTRLAAAKDTAQQAVTALLHGDRSLAGDLITGPDDLLALTLVLADLTAYTHVTWTRALGGDTSEAREGWASLMADIEEWRAQEPGR